MGLKRKNVGGGENWGWKEKLGVLLEATVYVNKECMPCLLPKYLVTVVSCADVRPEGLLSISNGVD